ncbi:MAG: hypothetical protein KKA48_08805, partial [Proteobacteria bacterium]|nr:hypothetical protein [Pseudomonadota bacterium]
MKPLFSESIQKSLELLLPLGIFIVVLLAGYGLRGYLLSRLSRWARETDSRTGDMVLTAVRVPVLVLLIMLAIYTALGFSDLPRVLVDKAEKVLSILATIAVAMVAANILSGFARIRAERIESVLPATRAMSTTSAGGPRRSRRCRAISSS